ncbi:hypothetical protein BJ742DRAFT_740200 [Cladochytrium replicatum]|nr:hypothetical protein BJ742DRAFT_740200 [Cladochytrium replicatum]
MTRITAFTLLILACIACLAHSGPVSNSAVADIPPNFAETDMSPQEPTAAERAHANATSIALAQALLEYAKRAKVFDPIKAAREEQAKMGLKDSSVPYYVEANGVLASIGNCWVGTREMNCRPGCGVPFYEKKGEWDEKRRDKYSYNQAGAYCSAGQCKATMQVGYSSTIQWSIELSTGLKFGYDAWKALSEIAPTIKGSYGQSQTTSYSYSNTWDIREAGSYYFGWVPEMHCTQGWINYNLVDAWCNTYAQDWAWQWSPTFVPNYRNGQAVGVFDVCNADNTGYCEHKN